MGEHVVYVNFARFHLLLKSGASWVVLDVIVGVVVVVVVIMVVVVVVVVAFMVISDDVGVVDCISLNMPTCLSVCVCVFWVVAF